MIESRGTYAEPWGTHVSIFILTNHIQHFGLAYFLSHFIIATISLLNGVYVTRTGCENGPWREQ